MADDRLEIRKSVDLGGFDIAHGADAQNLRAHEAKIDRRVNERDGKHDGLDALPKAGHESDGEDKNRKGLQHVRRAHQGKGQPDADASTAAVVTDKRAERTAEKRRKPGAENGDREIDARGVDRTAEDIHADVVGPEDMGAARRLQEAQGVGLGR